LEAGPPLCNGGSGDAAAPSLFRQDVRESQRTRLLQALADAVAEHGLRKTTVAEVARRAHVSRAAFSQCFDDLDSCFLALLDWMLGRGSKAAAAAFEREDLWEDGVLAGLEALLVFLDTYPVRSRACLLESMTGFPDGFSERARTLAELGQLVDTAARRRLALERHPPSTMPEAMVAAVLGMLRKRLLSGEAPPFVELLGPLTEIVITPYRGPSAAKRAARRGSSRAQAVLAERPAMSAPQDVEIPDMLRHASAHRLRSSLLYLADNPHASNKAVAAGIGISHSGQVSVLMARLHESGLVAKDCGGPGRSNAWRLSPYGAEVARAFFAR